MVNGLVNFPSIATGGRVAIPFNQINTVDGVRLVKLLLATTINMQNYVGLYQQHGRIVGNGIDIFTITPNGHISQVSRAYKNVKLDLR
jgi:hypothetical protein